MAGFKHVSDQKKKKSEKELDIHKVDCVEPTKV